MFGKVLVINKIEKILFYTFLFLIPFQIRAFLYWGGNEWNSVFLYLGDILFIGVLILWIRRLKWEKPDLFKFFKWERSGFLLVLFLIIAGISLFFADNLGVGVFRFIKLVEFGLVFLYVKNAIPIYKSHPNAPNTIYQILIASGIFQALLAILQFLKQSNLGLKFIEAGVFTPGAPGVATFIMENGEKVMRAYGSFPHPNVLAGFLLLCIFALYAKMLIGHIRPIGLISLIGLIFALFLTFSRTAIGVFLVMSLVMFLFYLTRHRLRMKTNLRIRVVRLFSLFIVSCLISTAILFPYLKSRFFEISLEEQAIDLRFFYNKMAFAMIKEKPFLGIGIGNFVWHSQNYPVFLRAASKMLGLEAIPQWIYQPVHNLYLLIAVEMGIIGLIVFIAILITNCIRMIRKVNPFFFLVIAFLILGLTDHYFWTLQSGGLIFWLALGLARI